MRRGARTPACRVDTPVDTCPDRFTTLTPSSQPLETIATRFRAATARERCSAFYNPRHSASLPPQPLHQSITALLGAPTP